MKNFSDLLTYLNISDRTPNIGQVSSDVISWGKTNRSSRTRIKVTLWLDSNDNNDRVVIFGQVVLNIKRTAPEKNVDFNLEIHHHSDFDSVKRRFQTSHPEQYFRIDGQNSPDHVKSFYSSFFEQIDMMERDESYQIPGIKDYKKT